MKINFWDIFPITAFDYQKNTDFAAEVKQNLQNRRSFAQTLAERYTASRSVRPFHPGLITDNSNLRKYKFRSEMFNGSEEHMRAANDANVANDTKNRKEIRKEIASYEHYHHQDLMTAAELDRTNHLMLLKAFKRETYRDLQYVALMTREAFMLAIRSKFIENWDKSQNLGKKELNKQKGLTPNAIPQSINNLPPSQFQAAEALEERKLNIDPNALENIARLLAGTAVQAMSANQIANLPANPAENHMKNSADAEKVSSVGASMKSKAS